MSSRMIKGISTGRQLAKSHAIKKKAKQSKGKQNKKQNNLSLCQQWIMKKYNDEKKLHWSKIKDSRGKSPYLATNFHVMEF